MVKVFVGNIQAESCRETESELRHLFEQFGEVTECDILTGKNFGFVHMTKEEEADAAINGLDGAYVFGGNITVEKSANQSRGRNSRGTSRGGNSRGGYGRGFGGGGRYRPYGRPMDDPYYSLYDDPYLGYPYPLPRDPYGRDRYLRQLYARELYARDAYYRRYRHDPYARDRNDYEERPYTSRYSRDYYGKDKSSGSAAGESGGEEN